MNPDIMLPANESPEIRDAIECARRQILASASDASLRVYLADFVHFSRWCAEHGFTPLPALPEICCF